MKASEAARIREIASIQAGKIRNIISTTRCNWSRVVAP
jgi:hypothetical protein